MKNALRLFPFGLLLLGDAVSAAELEEIVVTAQKREESLLEVPISIAALSGEELDESRFNGIADALNRVAGVNLFTANQSGGSKIAIRGVGAGGPLFRGSGTVGFYIDDVPFNFVKSAIVPDTNSYDLERVEALRGPQGTLYGANALNGVVRIITKDASLTDYEFKARAALSTTDGGSENYRADLAASAPLIPGKLGVRASVGYNDLSGWIDNSFTADANDGELANFRLKANAQPTERLSAEVTAWASRADYGAPAYAPDGGISPARVPEPLSIDYEVVGLTFGYEFPSFSVHSTTGYIDYTSTGFLDYLNIDRLYTGLFNEALSQELRLTSTGEGSWQWSVGAYYRDAEDTLVQRFDVRTALLILDVSDQSKSFAVFGELTRSLFDGALDLTAGLRYFEDEVSSWENVSSTGNPAAPLVRSGDRFDTVTPRFVLAWYPRDDVTVYGSYSEGFRSGYDQYAAVLSADPNYPPVKEDTLNNYELGLKGKSPGGRVQYDVAAYYLEWKDIQQTLLTTTLTGQVINAPLNAGTASGPGVDFGLTLRPTDKLALGLTLGWNDLTMDTEVLSGGVVLFQKGDRTTESPEYTMGFTGDYAFPVGTSGFRGSLSVAADYHSELTTRTIVAGALRLGIPDEILNTRASLSLDSPKDWGATLYIDNATNEDGASATHSFFATTWKTRLRPRTVGVQFEYRY